MAEGVTEAIGSAEGWLARPATLAQERELAAAMAAAHAAEYPAVAAEAWTAHAASAAVRAAALRRLRAELRRITRRDYFPPAAREQAHAAVGTLAGLPGTSPDAVPARQDAAAADSAGEHS